MRRKSMRFVLGILVGAAFLYLSLRGLEWRDIETEIRRISPMWVLLALALYWCELGLRILRWRTLLSHLQPQVPGLQVAISFTAGYAANNLLPAKLGELFRADLLGRLANVSRLTALGSIIVERMFDLAIVLVMATWGVAVLTTADAQSLARVNQGLLVLLIILAAALGCVYLLLGSRSYTLPGRLAVAGEYLGKLTAGLHAFEYRPNYVRLVLVSLIIWLLNCLSIWSIVMSLNVRLGPGETILLVGISGISAAIPAAPAGIGTLQYAFHLTALLLGISASAAVVASSLVQVVLLGSATLVGGLAYAYAVSAHLIGQREAG
jgi:uncharacterized protein (TIRG00374 family)